MKTFFTKYIPALLTVIEPEFMVNLTFAIVAFEKLSYIFSRLFRKYSGALDIKKYIIDPFNGMILHTYNFFLI